MRGPEQTFQQMLEDALFEVPYRIAVSVIAEKLSGQGIQLTEHDREQLAEHLKTSDGSAWSSPGAPGDECVRIEITESDTQLIDQRVEQFMAENVPELVITVGERIAEEVFPRLHETWGAEAEIQRVERCGFQERLSGRWGEAVGQLQMLLTVAREFGEFEGALLGGSEASDSPVLAGVLLRLQARACQVTDEIIGLLCAGFSDGAMARWRTLHEIAAVAMLLKEQGESVAQRYVDHDVIESARAARDYDECCERLGYEPMDEVKLADLRRQHQAVVAKYGAGFDQPYGWAADALGVKKPTLRDVRAAAGIDHMRSHYRMASHNVHANPKGLFFKLGLLGDTDVLLAGPSNAGLSEPGQNAAISLTQVCSALGTLQPTMDGLVVLHLMNRMTTDVCAAFHAAGEQLERDSEEEQ